MTPRPGAGPAMRIAMIAHTDAPWTPHFARALTAFGHTVRVFSFCPDTLPGVDTQFVGTLPYAPLENKKPFLLCVPKVMRALRAFRPDVVLATYLISNGLTAALSWFGPLVVSAVGSDVLRPRGTLRVPSTARRALIRLITRRATLLHAVSDGLVAALQGYDVPRERIRMFPAGVDTGRFAAAPSNKVTNADPNEAAAPVILCTRRHAPVYDNDVIVAALQRLRGEGLTFTARFVSGGVQLDERRAQIARLGLSDIVSCPGFTAHERIPAELAAADIYVSAARSDGTSASLLEALAVGPLPVLTDIDANRPWITDGETGLLFPVGDVDALTTALRRALTDVALRDGARSRNRAMVVARADEATCMAALEAVLRDAVQTHKR